MTDLVSEVIDAEAELARMTTLLRTNYLSNPLPRRIEDSLKSINQTLERLREAIEDWDAHDAHLRTRNQESVPDDIAGRLLEGENPVRVWREHRGLSLRSLAQKAGSTPSVVSAIETGKSGGRPATLRRIAEVLDVGLEELVPRSSG